jgi:hypothetical protein
MRTYKKKTHETLEKTIATHTQYPDKTIAIYV